MPTASPLSYPFSAVVGSDDLRRSLILCAISPEIGGVLVRGEKGTAKSTTVRALAEVLPPVSVIEGDRFSTDVGEPSPDGPFSSPVRIERPARLVELPVGATEDRVVGSLHLAKALSEGVAEFEPGLLARAHRGLLYVDEVNLLHDHLVDLLLDAAAMGRCTVERDGVSLTHPARFVLVGTMNPEEGELRPQLLDRFGLTVSVTAPRDPALRVEVVRRRMAFDADPAGFVDSYAGAEAELTARIAAARAAVSRVQISEAALLKVAHVCAGFEVDGLRADLVMTRAALAHAAWVGRDWVTREDLRAAALLALPHRRRRNPFDAPGLDEDLLDRLLGDEEPDPSGRDSGAESGAESGGPESGGPESGGPESGGPESGGPESGGPESGGPESGGPESGGPESGGPESGGERGPESGGPTPPTEDGVRTSEKPSENLRQVDAKSSQEIDGSARVVGAGTPYRPRFFRVDGVGAGEAGGRSRAITSIGRTVSISPVSRGNLHLLGTLLAAVPHQSSRGRSTGRLRLSPDDLRGAIREGRESNLVIFCVDASGSMAARQRMEQVKTAILSLLLDAYQRRDKVALITFRGNSAEVALPPTGSIDVAARRLDDLPAGGRTPLAEGLLAAADLIRREKLRDATRRPLLIVVTDGRATSGSDAIQRSLQAAELLAGVETVLVDCETGRFRMGLAVPLSIRMGAEHLPLAQVSASALAEVAKRRVA